VRLDAVRSGVGRSLCAATFEAARERGFVKLSAMIRADNPGALRFYQSQGFRVLGVAERHALVRGRYIDEVLAERFIA
jgi:L-amino acid N-acyltransferase YncA